MSTNLQNIKYTPGPPPSIDPTSPLYLQRELKKLEAALNSIAEALKSLDARVTALGG
jgi:hypothetical protein